MDSKFSKLAPLYTPLSKTQPQIRLLQFNRPFSRDEQIKCTLSNATLDSDPKYVALSYEWGDSSALEDIIVNGKPLPVSRNLVSALKGMGSQLSDQSFWVDAISINQIDIEERNHQVQMMKRIYQRATTVFAWLGDSDDDAKRAMGLLKSLSNAGNDFAVRNQYRHIAEGLDLEGMDMDGLSDLLEEIEVGVQTLHALFSRSYWQRVWIVQETMLAKDLICFCGRDTFTFEQLETAACFAFLLSRTPGVVKLGTMIYLSHSPLLLTYLRVSRDLSAIEPTLLFNMTRDLHASDPRDHIYGLLGLINFKIQPDYSLSITLTTQLTALNFAGTAMTIEEDRTEGVPTWTPDWVALSIYDQNPHLHTSEASGGMPAEARISTDLSTIWLKGIRCDEIKSVVPNSGNAIDNPRSLADYWWSLILNPDGIKSYPTSMTRIEATFWLIFRKRHRELSENSDKLRGCVIRYCMLLDAANGIEDIVMQLSHHESDSIIEQFSNDNAADPILMKAILGLCVRFGQSVFTDLDAVFASIVEISEEMNSDTDSHNYAIRTIMDSRLLINNVAFHTAKGYIGMLPYCRPNKTTDDEAGRSQMPNVILPGDVVCVLVGQDHPVILRRKDSHYILIGACTVSGLMDGEAVQPLSAGLAEGETFEIR
ncbi:heterokaryon incompatibility protein-domain-containing protein [Leptodontidium sp. MPI-SDFR-AT-0119]|nr:heterokaryon incompatibility protein-domain-containing protein [Leptodontidium sp. MPI-SDFR-AT-0119]